MQEDFARKTQHGPKPQVSRTTLQSSKPTLAGRASASTVRVQSGRSRVPISLFKSPLQASEWAEKAQKDQMARQKAFEEQKAKAAYESALLELSGQDTNDTGSNAH